MPALTGRVTSHRCTRFEVGRRLHATTLCRLRPSRSVSRRLGGDIEEPWVPLHSIRPPLDWTADGRLWVTTITSQPLKALERLHHVTDISRRDVLRGGASMATIAAAAAAPNLDAYAAGPHQPRLYLPYSRNSFFKSRVKGAPINHVRTREFHHFMATYPDQRYVHHPRINGVDGNDWGTVFAVGQRHDPVWRLTGDVQEEVSRLRDRGFHAPAWLGRKLTGTSDSPFCVMEVVSGITVFGTGARHVGRHTISVTSAAVTHHDSNGLDRRNPRSNDQRNF